MQKLNYSGYTKIDYNYLFLGLGKLYYTRSKENQKFIVTIKHKLFIFEMDKSYFIIFSYQNVKYFSIIDIFEVFSLTFGIPD